MATIAFEDIEPGAVTTFGGVRVDRDEMIAFAREFDPQPFHVDEAAARDTFVGRLIASGWYTGSLQMRMLCDAWLLEATSLGGPGIEELRWLRPVVAGDVLSVRQTITETRVSKSRPGMGIVRFFLETLNGAGEVVMTQAHVALFARRGMAGIERETPQAMSAKEGETASALPAASPAPLPLAFEDVEVGRETDLGEHLFTREDVVRFGRSFDPQPFHVDEAAAAASHFGRLAASGWHTGSAFMRHLVDSRAQAQRDAVANGQLPPRYGSSPGFKDLRWLRPVHAGDTVRYATTVTGKRLSGSRPGWGIVLSHATGANQRGERVFEFAGSVFMAQRDAP
ncbi:MAG: MaoC family dehydratase [Methylobacteriaceae bacterium]|nr:MaoC family dehydratase [Methylobacteriaceae bacterium]